MIEGSAKVTNEEGGMRHMFDNFGMQIQDVGKPSNDQSKVAQVNHTFQIPQFKGRKEEVKQPPV